MPSHFKGIRMEEKKVKKSVSLKSLLTPSKTVGIEFPGMEGFEVKLTYLAREELLKLRNRSVTQVLNKRTRAYEEQLDNDLLCKCDLGLAKVQPDRERIGALLRHAEGLAERIDGLWPP